VNVGAIRAGEHSMAPAEPVLLVGATPWWIADGLEQSMAVGGWTCITADDVERARWLASIRRVSMVVVAGDRAFRWEVVEAVGRLAAAPLAVVAPESDHPDEVVALLAAGVDLVVSPAEPGEALLARLAAVIRRADARRGPGVRYLRAHDLVVDLWSQQCSLRGELLSLSPIEYQLLTFLMTRPAVTMSTGAIVRRVWGQAPADGRNALRIVVNRLRRKLGDDPRHPEFIAAIRGSGYRFVANVAEVADSLVDHAARVDVTPLLESLTTFAERLANHGDGGDGEAAAAGVLVDVLETAGVADGMAVFRNDGTRMRLVAQRQMPDAWLDAVAGGVPFDPSFASAQSVLSGEVVQFADVRAMKGQFGATARQLSGDGFRACHFVPIARAGHTWGHLGLARRSPSPLDTVTMAYLRSLCATFLLHLDDRGRSQGSERRG
jgi:DNA-binding response OmpR family regulator